MRFLFYARILFRTWDSRLCFGWLSSNKFAFCHFLCLVVLREIIAELSEHSLLMPRNNVGVFLSFGYLTRIDDDRKSVRFFPFPDRTEDVFISDIAHDLFRRMKHQHLLLVVFSGQDNICCYVMRKHITTEVDDLLEGEELFAKKIFQEVSKLRVLLHKIFHAREDSSETADGRKIAKDIFLVRILMNIAEDLLDHLRVKRHGGMVTGRDTKGIFDGHVRIGFHAMVKKHGERKELIVALQQRNLRKSRGCHALVQIDKTFLLLLI